MIPSSAMALVSAMPSAAMLAFLSACSALEMASPFLLHPISKVVAMAPASAVLMNVRLVVLIVSFFVDCRPNDTVSVFAHAVASSPPCRFGIWSSIELWGHLGKENGAIVLREPLGNRVLQSNQLVTFWGPRRRHAPHQTPIAAWRTTGGPNTPPYS